LENKLNKMVQLLETISGNIKEQTKQNRELKSTIDKQTEKLYDYNLYSSQQKPKEPKNQRSPKEPKKLVAPALVIPDKCDARGQTACTSPCKWDTSTAACIAASHRVVAPKLGGSTTKTIPPPLIMDVGMFDSKKPHQITRKTMKFECLNHQDREKLEDYKGKFCEEVEGGCSICSCKPSGGLGGGSSGQMGIDLICGIIDDPPQCDSMFCGLEVGKKTINKQSGDIKCSCEVSGH